MVLSSSPFYDLAQEVLLESKGHQPCLRTSVQETACSSCFNHKRTSDRTGNTRRNRCHTPPPPSHDATCNYAKAHQVLSFQHRMPFRGYATVCCVHFAGSCTSHENPKKEKNVSPVFTHPTQKSGLADPNEQAACTGMGLQCADEAGSYLGLRTERSMNCTLQTKLDHIAGLKAFLLP